MPPPGGYGAIPYKRNIPIRGPTGWVLFALSFGMTALAIRLYKSQMRLYQYEMDESFQAENALMPLIEAEKDRAMLRQQKETVESEALNIVGSGYNTSFKPGEVNGNYSYKNYEPPTGNDDSLLMPAIYSYYGLTRFPRCGP